MSIQTEITRITGAKQSLKDWLLDHDVEVSLTAKLDELVALLSDVDTGSGSGGSSDKETVPVSVLFGTGTSNTSTITPPGSSVDNTLVSTGTAYNIPANSLLVVYATGNSGGTTKMQAYIGVDTTGDLSYTTVYQVASNASLTKPFMIAAVKVGTKGGTITFSRKTASGSIM